MNQQAKSLRLITISCLLLAIIGIAAIYLLQEEEYLRIESPNGQYLAIITAQRYESLLPALPGQSGDRSGFVQIQDKDGLNFGKVRVPMVSMARDIVWTTDGAELKLICKWDFAKREYRFWNKAQTKEIVLIAE